MRTFASKFKGLLVGVGLLLGPLGLGSAHAQETALMAGVVAAEETMVPVPGARVTLVDTDLQTLSGENGTFTFPATPLGRATVRVDAPGFPTMVQQVEVTSDAVVFIQFLLPSVAAFLDDILVTGQAGKPSALSEVRTAADLLVGQFPGIGGNSGIVGYTRAPVQLRGVSSISVRSEPDIYLDGVRMAGSFGEALRILQQIPANDVKDVRVLRGPSASVEQGSADGVIYVRTRSGADR